MNAHEKHQAGPAAHFNDSGIACPVQHQRHAPHFSKIVDADQEQVDAGVVKFEGGDGESNGGYQIYWRDHGKGILACYPVLSDIQLCAAAVGEDLVSPTCQGLVRTQVGCKVILVYGLLHAPVLLVCDFEGGQVYLED